MGLARDEREWDELARVDPLWAVLSTPGRRGGRWDDDAFLATGREEVREVLAGAGSWFGLPRARRRALDFGCGVGRLTRALAEHFERVDGVDVSGEMVARARARHADLADRVAFHHNPRPDLSGFGDRSVDLLYSSIALQHVSSPSLAVGYLAEFVRLLASGGVACFQVPAAVPRRIAWNPRKLAYRVARRAGLGERALAARGLYAMNLTAVPEARVRAAVETAGGAVLAVVPVSRAGSEAIDDRLYWACRREDAEAARAAMRARGAG